MKRICTLPADEFCALPRKASFSRVAVVGPGSFESFEGKTPHDVAEIIKEDTMKFRPESDRALRFTVSFPLHEAPEEFHEWIVARDHGRVNPAPADSTPDASAD